MPQFLDLVQQHIIAVVGNLLYCCVANLTEFSAVKEFGKSVKI